MFIRLYNTLSRTKETFVPQEPERVTMYACGPTVYSSPHIGNARPAVVFDLLYRTLARRYPQVVYARNITDVDDKINAAACEEGVPIGEISDRFTRAYHEDMAALGVCSPTIEPRATDHVSEMLEMIQALLARGHAYVAEGHVLFHVPSFDDYGRLSRQNREEVIDGARVEVAPFKRDPADFVLWKPSAPEIPGWDSPWGRGRPGWHLECSCMAEAHLGRTIDIHAGGSNLVFPHHENEIAQSTCAHDGELYCRYWVHNGFVNVDSEKMSKSVGNVLLVKDLLDQAPGEAVRLALLTAHYRSPLEWGADTLVQAARRLDRLYGVLAELADVAEDPAAAPAPPVVEALEDDLNTPIALAGLSALAREAQGATGDEARRAGKSTLLASGALLGLLHQPPAHWLEQRRGVLEDAADVERLIEARASARAGRDFVEADRIRDELAERGVVLEDGAAGTTWRRAETVEEGS